MAQHFFESPILNSPYTYPARHWELDEDGQPTDRVLNIRRPASFITPVPKPKKRKKTGKRGRQNDLPFGADEGVSTDRQAYDPTWLINTVRREVDIWRKLPRPDQWRVTPETARLLQHWRHHDFQGIRPFFCQVEAIETLIWLTEVLPDLKRGDQKIRTLIRNANQAANPSLHRIALKLATGAGKTMVMAMIIA